MPLQLYWMPFQIQIRMILVTAVYALGRDAGRAYS